MDAETEAALRARVATWRAATPDPLATGLAGMAEAGLFRVGLTEYPGYTAIARVKDALAEATGLPGLAGMWAGGQLVARHFLLGFASAEQRATFLPRLASGTARLAVAISEPNAGAHPRDLTTRARQEGPEIILTGAKAWVSNALEATHLIVFAITAERDGRKTYGAFLVPSGAPGLAIAPMPGFAALRPSRHCAVTLADVRLPAASRLGPKGDAFPAMALPFRDVEDAVGAAGFAGAIRHALARLAPALPQGADPDLGALAGLAAVLDHAARAVVAALDAGRLAQEAAAGVGLRVLAADLSARLGALIAAHAPPDDPARTRLLADLDAILGIARGPRAIRQARLGAALRAGAPPSRP
jgi:acyl-CoA dehydrogenase